MRQSGDDAVIVHLSDVHATDGALLYDAIDGVARIGLVQDYLERTGLRPDAVVITGDLVQSGQVGAYVPLGVALTRLEDAIGAPVLVVPGNHDHPAGFLSLPQSLGSASRVVELERVRIVLLDSSSTRLGVDQLRFVADELHTRYRQGTIVALHHPPVPSPLASLSRAGLRDADALVQMLSTTDARLVLAGHYHHPLAAQVAGLPVWVGPALSYRQDMAAPADTVSGVDSVLFSVVRLSASGHSVVPISLNARPALFRTQAHLPTTVATTLT